MPIAHVNSIAGLRAALADPNVTSILVAAGDYNVVNADQGNGNAGFTINRSVTIAVDTTAPGYTAGARANFHSATALGRGIFYTTSSATDVTFDGIGFLDTKVNNGDSNVAGIRAEGQNLTIKNSLFQNDGDGILATPFPGKPLGDLSVINTTFKNNGDSSGQDHSLYFEGNNLLVDGSSFSNSGAGHHVKSVASVSTIVRNSTLSDDTSGANQAINVTGGGSLLVENNIIHKGPPSSSSFNPYVIFYTAERNGGSPGSVTVRNNQISSDFYLPGQPSIKGFAATVLLGTKSDQIAQVTGNIFTDSSGNTAQTLPTSNLIGGLASLANNSYNGQSLAYAGTAAASVVGNNNNNNVVLSSSLFPGASLRNYKAGSGNNVIATDFRDPGQINVIGGSGNDVISGTGAAGSIYGGAGNDTLFSPTNPYNSYTSGGEGNDILIGGTAANPYLDGGAGNDILDARQTSGAQLVGGAGNDILLAGNGIYTHLDGGAGSDIIVPGGGQFAEIYGGLADDPGTDVVLYRANYDPTGNNGLAVRDGDYTSNVAGYKVVYTNKTGGDAQLGGVYGGTNVTNVLHNVEIVEFANGYYDNRTKVFTPNVSYIDTKLVPSGQSQLTKAQILNFQAPTDPGQPILPYANATKLTSATGDVTGTSGADIILGRIDAAHPQKLIGGSGNDTYIIGSGYVPYVAGGTSLPTAQEAVNGGIDTLAVSFDNKGTVKLPDNVEIGVSYGIYNSGGGTPTFIGNNLGDLFVDVDNHSSIISETSETIKVVGGAGDDVFLGGNGNDVFDGGGGTNTAILRGNFADFRIGSTDGRTLTTTDLNAADGNDGTDTYTNVQYLQFVNGRYNTTTQQFVAGSYDVNHIAYAGGSFDVASLTFTGTALAAPTPAPAPVSSPTPSPITSSPAAPKPKTTSAPSPTPPPPVVTKPTIITASPTPTPAPTGLPASVNSVRALAQYLASFGSKTGAAISTTPVTSPSSNQTIKIASPVN